MPGNGAGRHQSLVDRSRGGWCFGRDPLIARTRLRCDPRPDSTDPGGGSRATRPRTAVARISAAGDRTRLLVSDRASARDEPDDRSAPVLAAGSAAEDSNAGASARDQAWTASLVVGESP